MSDMSKRIKELREKHGMTLEQVGNIVGVGKSTVRKWETGDIANMRRDKIAKLAEALHTTPAYLMGWDVDIEDTSYKIEAADADAWDKLNAEFNPQAVQEAIALYQKFQELPPEKQAEFQSFLEFLQSKS